MKDRIQKLAVLISTLFALGSLAGSVNAQCVTCTGAGGPYTYCITASSGWGSCTTSPDPDIGCKVSCPNCPAEGCSGSGGGGGGGGGGCLVYGSGFSATMSTTDQSVVTTAIIFRSDAATNAHLFGGRGQGYRVLSGAAFGTFDARTALQAISREATGSDLKLAFAVTNINEAAIPTTFATRSGEAFTFAPQGNGASAQLQFRVKSFAKLSRAIDSASLTSNDVLLVDLQVRGQAYVLALRSESISRSAADFAQRVQAVQDALRQSLLGLPRDADPAVFIIPDC